MNALDAPQSAPPSDGDLLAAFADRRHEEAFAELVRRHGGMVLAVCRSVLHNPADAEDAAQAVFLTLAQKAHSPAVRGHLVGWLHRVAWYVAARGAEARATRRRREQEAATMRREARPADDENIPLDALHAELARLPEKYRLPLVLHHLEGRSHLETAGLVRCSAAAVAVRLHRGREMLRKRLERRGVVASAVVLAGVWGPQAMAQLPPAFVAETARAAAAVAAGPLAAAAVSAPALALSKGALNMLFWTQVKAVAIAVGVVVFAGVVSTVVFAATREAAAPQTVTGVITEVKDGQLTLRRRAETVTVPLDSDTAVTVDDKPATAAALKAGMAAAAVVEAGKPATEVRAYSPKPPAPGNFRTGSVTRVGGNALALQARTGDPIVVPLDADTVVTIDGRPAAASDLGVGMGAAAFFEPGRPATDVRAYSSTPDGPRK